MQNIIQPIVAFKFEFSAVPKQEFLPPEVIVVGEVLPIFDCVIETSGFSNMLRLGEVYALRDHNQ
jgi:hypothetical protein